MAGIGKRSRSRCVLARENHGAFIAVYIARVRISVQAGRVTVIREGHGTGESRGSSPGEVHDTALKAAETDATKRALATFGNPFGLALYGTGKSASRQPGAAHSLNVAEQAQRFGFHPDDTTPIPRPSRYYGRRQYPPLIQQLRNNRADQRSHKSSGPPLVPAEPNLTPRPIDKSQLMIAEPKRLRDKAHLKFVAAQPCLVCGRQPADPHHLRFAQPRAIGLKVSDEFTVPLCRGHHRELHQTGNESVWWKGRNIDALQIAKELWAQTHSDTAKHLPDAQRSTSET